MAHFYARNGAGDLLARYSFIEPLLEGRRVLEIGAANATSGGSALFLAERGAAAVLSLEEGGADVATARESGHHPFVQFRSGSPDDLPSGAFDLVLVSDGAVLGREAGRIAALRRLLAAGGRLVTAFPAGGSGLAEIAGEPAPEELPSYEGIVGALADHFALVEVATQSPTVGWVIALAADGEEPDVAMDGTLAGTPETAAFLAICGEEPCGLSGLQIVALPTGPLLESGGAARGALEAADEARAERNEVQAQLAARAEALYQAVAERDEAAAARDEARAEREAALQGREAGFDARAALDRIQAADADREREVEGLRFQLRSATDASTRLQAELADRRGAAVEAEAALRAARSESQAAKSAVETVLARAVTAEGELAEREEADEARERDDGELATLRARAVEADAARERDHAELGAAHEEVERLRHELAPEREEARLHADEKAARAAEAAAIAEERTAGADALAKAGGELEAARAEAATLREELEKVRAAAAARAAADEDPATGREGLGARVAELEARLESEGEKLAQASARADAAEARVAQAEQGAGGRGERLQEE